MKILIAEDEPDIAMLYKIVLEKRDHHVVITDNGEECLKAYHDALKQKPNSDSMPFGAVVLDYKMPKKDGMEVAKEILAVNPNQRIIFASAYVVDTLADSVKQLGQIIELLQKPFELDVLITTIEDKEIHSSLERLNVSVKQIKDLNPAREQIRDLLVGLSKIQKHNIWYAVNDTLFV